ncbi:MAG: FAD-binding protein [Thermoplasmata archaeon]|nr:FAD-binding protein [Thermoplasmata archaeon]MCI4359671.1 FAD-binding protein [Thermoplasmata archaeon]
MELAVLIKVVPDHEALGYDALRLNAVRAGVDLFLNPFDQRALRVALDLRRPGDRVSVASMGPLAAAPVLAEAFALGADRVSLVSDPALAGSDTLVTARVLTRLLGAWGSEVVLLGARSTDGETGQVPAEIAALRQVPLVGSARRVEWDGDSGALRVTQDTEEGWSRWRVRPPCVVSVGEKATKIVHPTEGERQTAASRPVEVVSLRELDMPSGLVGSEGSPTRVVSVRSESSRRRGVVLNSGPLGARIAQAVAILNETQGAGSRTGGAPAGMARARPGALCSLVLVSGGDGRLEERSLPMLSESWSALGLPPAAVWVGSPPSEEDRIRLGRAGAVELFTASVPGPTVEGRTAALGVEHILLSRTRFEAGWFLSSDFGREVAGRVAARLGLGLTGDAISVERAPDGSILWSKPAFGGNATAAVVSRTRPSLATVRPGVFGGRIESAEGAISETTVAPSDGPTELEPIDRGVEPLEGYGDLDRARVAVSVGVGIGGPLGIERVRRLVEGTGWAIAATRRVVDSGWVPRRLQVGLTGRSAAPHLVILAGVRGSPNHLVGWKRAGQILAINPDPQAPVFPSVDVGLVATWEEALPPLIAALRVRFADSGSGASGSTA